MSSINYLQTQVAASKQGLSIYERHFQNDTANIISAYKELVRLQTNLIEALQFQLPVYPTYQLEDDYFEIVDPFYSDFDFHGCDYE
ncbi:hypothetical protein [Methylomonas sp. HYX-M1]|uniref:hypothetical protein n=1 Tax=Methylomonas sp. HYX-M1 TaxID=3139307 RepID=UPI00345B7CDC